MTNYTGGGDVVEVTAPANVVSGQPVLVGSIFGVAIRAASSGAVVPIQITGRVRINKDTSLIISQGDRVFWDAANAWVDKTATAQFPVGRSLETTLAATATVEILLGNTAPAGA